MRTGKVAMLAVAAVLLAGSSEAQKKAPAAKCTDVPIWLTITETGGGVLAGDGSAIYKGDEDNLTFTKINICGATPTYDATIDLIGSQRTMAFTFPAAVANSTIYGLSPVWADGSTFSTQPFFYVRNILWGRMNGYYTFTTRLIVKSIIGPNDAAVYDLRLQPQVVDALANDPPFADTNDPSETASVTVQDIPGTCRSDPNGTLDSWIVTVNAPYLGTLYKRGSRKSGGYLHSGQYVTPMRLLVEARSCIPLALTTPPIPR